MVVEQAPGVTLAVNGSVPLALFTSQRGDGRRGAASPAAARRPSICNIESSAIGLQIVTGLTTAVEQVTGTATVKLHVTGTADNPLFDGGVALNGGGFFVPATGRRYRDLTTRVTFEPGRMKVDGLKVFDEEGDTLEVGGVLGLRRLAFGDVQMHAQARRFGFVRNDMARLEVDLDLDVTGQVTRPTIVGKAVIEQGRVEVDRVLASLDRRGTPAGPGRRRADRRQGTEAGATAGARAGRRSRPTRPCGCAEPGTPARRGRGPAGPMAPSAPAGHGRGARPSSTSASRFPRTCCCAARTSAATRRPPASATSRSSSAATSASRRIGGGRRRSSARSRPRAAATSTYGRRFEILRDGRIQFQGGPEIDPALDVTARRVIEPSGVEARIRVQGTARNPTLSFSSTPPLDESDILALIIFNRDLNSLGASEKGTVASMAGTAAAGLVVSPLADTLGRKLGLEEIDVQTTNDAGTPGGVVTVGDRLGDRLFVRLRQQFGAQEVSEFLLEYRLSELLRLQGAVAEGDGVGRANRSLTRRVERGGLDVVFYYRY